jgi:prepilin peptidase dependent protein B
MRQKQNGYSLIELMIGLAAGVFVMGASLTAYVAMLKANRETLQMTRLEHEMRTSMSIMVNDLRRARYWGQAMNDVDTGTITNPFVAAGADLSVAANCVLFSYDLNSDGTLPALNTAPNDERFGFRLSNSTLQMRPNAHTSFSCADANNAWENLTNPNVVNVTGLTFTGTDDVIDADGAGPDTITVTISTVTISITAQLASDPTVQRTLTEIIRIRNNKITP